MTIAALAQLIAQVESNGNPNAVRFEPAFRPQHILQMEILAKCSGATAQILGAMSFGLYQIMGDNLVSMGLHVSPIAYCADGVMQLDFFNRFVTARGINYALQDILTDNAKRDNFSRHYNGAGNIPAYSARLLSVYRSSLA